MVYDSSELTPTIFKFVLSHITSNYEHSSCVCVCFVFVLGVVYITDDPKPVPLPTIYSAFVTPATQTRGMLCFEYIY